MANPRSTLPKPLFLLSLAILVGAARGVGGILPVSHIDFANRQHQQHQQPQQQKHERERRDETTCPGPLDPPTICDDLSAPELIAPCAEACLAAACCSGECQATCTMNCITYAPCLNLPGGGGGGDGDGDPDGACRVLTVDYHSGFNVHFQVGEEDAMALMPDSRFTPLTSDDVNIPGGGRRRRLKKKKANKGNVPVSLYAATIGVDFAGQRVTSRRADLFAYALDPDRKPSLVILAAYVEVPLPFQSNSTLLENFKKSVTDLALDSRTGLPAFDHVFVNEFVIEKDAYFFMAGGDLQEKTIQVALGDACDKDVDVGGFPLEFVLANSLTWRSPIDKNVNYFNQDFIAAPVSTYQMSKDCPAVADIDALLEKLPASASLAGIDAYGSDDAPITWQFEDSTDSAGTPYLTLDEQNAAIGLKRPTFSALWFARASAPETIIRLRQGANSVYVLWEIDDAKVDDLSNALNLPLLELVMATIRTHEGVESKYYFMLNVYTSEIEGDPGGEATRYEYSVFVKREGQDSDRPFYMVIEAGSSNASIDPVYGQTPAKDSTISREGDVIRFQADAFVASIDIGENVPLTADPEWLYANDFVFWGNGVYDKVFMETSFTLQRPKKGVLTIESGSFSWATYLVDIDQPDYADVYEEENRFVVSPWNGIEEMQARLLQAPPSGVVTALLASLGAIQAIKQAFVPGIALGNAAAIAAGQQPLVDFTVLADYPDHPKIMINFKVSKKYSIKEFARLIHLPDGLELVPMSVPRDSKSDIIVTLEVILVTLPIEIEGFVDEYKVVWKTYVKDSETDELYSYDLFPFDAPRAMYDIGGILETAPEEITVKVVGSSSLDVSIANAGTHFHISAPLVTADTVKGVSPSWVDSYQRAYWNKNVYDGYHYNGDLYYAKLLPINVKDVTFERAGDGAAAWLDSIDESPFEAFYFDGRYTFVAAPYENLEELYDDLE